MDDVKTKEKLPEVARRAIYLPLSTLAGRGDLFSSRNRRPGEEKRQRTARGSVAVSLRCLQTSGKRTVASVPVWWSLRGVMWVLLNCESGFRRDRVLVQL